MATARDTTAEHIKPLEGAIVRRFTSGAAIAAGELVSMSSDGYIDPSDSTAAKNYVLGVAIQAASSTGAESVNTRCPNGPMAVAMRLCSVCNRARSTL